MSSSSETKAVKAPKEITTLTQWYAKAVKNIGEGSPAFLSLTRAFLISGDWQVATRPILNQWDYGTITAHACIESLFQALVSWQANKAMAVAIENIDANLHKGNWLVQVFGDKRPTCPDGSLIKEQSFNTFKDASGWADRRLVETYSDAYAVLTAQTEATVITVSRHDALYRLREKSNNPVCKVTGKTTSSLSWGAPKRGSSRAHFSHG